MSPPGGMLATAGGQEPSTKGYRERIARNRPGFKGGFGSLYLICTEKRHGQRGRHPPDCGVSPLAGWKTN